MKFKKTILLIISVVLIACCTVSGTLALPSISEIFEAIFEKMKTPEDETQLTFDVQLDIREIEGDLLQPGKAYTKEIAVRNSEESTVPIYCWFTYSVPKVMVENYGSKNVAPLTFQFSDSDAWQINAKQENVTIDGEQFVQFTCIYNKHLEPGETTPLCMKSISLDVHVSHDANRNYYWNEAGYEPKILFRNSAMPMYVKAYAVNALEVDNAMNGMNSDNVVTSD